MSTPDTSKINQLLTRLPTNAVVVSSWLTDQGYSPELQKRYRTSGWFKSIGTGAMMRPGDELNYLGAVYAMQQQLGMSVHPGGRTALFMSGLAHYLETGNATAQLFGHARERLPSWFVNNNWDKPIAYYATSFLPGNIGYIDYNEDSFSVRISGAVRAIMECLFLAPGKMDLVECYEIIEGLNNLIPDQVQSLLEMCTSVKVKRLFLFMAEKAGHRWMNMIHPDRIDLGRGKRSIVKDGYFDSKYQITMPKELNSNG